MARKPTFNLKLSIKHCHFFVEKPFPKTLTNVERAFIHEKCIEFGLKSKSQGKGSDRFLVVYKTLATNADDHFEDCPPLKLTKKSKSQLFEYLNRCPLSKDETKILDEFSTSDNAGREKSTSSKYKCFKASSKLRLLLSIRLWLRPISQGKTENSQIGGSKRVELHSEAQGKPPDHQVQG